jgi:hypothetical protein
MVYRYHPCSAGTIAAWFSGAFAKLRKATTRFVMCVCLSPPFCMEQLGFQLTDFDEI